MQFYALVYLSWFYMVHCDGESI